MSKPDSYNICSQILSDMDYSSYQISYILARKENNTIQYQAYTVSKDDPEEMICVIFNNEDSYELHSVVAWVF